MQVNVQTAPAVFNFAPDLSLRVFDADGNPWFVAADIEKMFGLTNLRKRITSLDDDEKTTIASPSGGSLTLVNESGMWTLVLRSDAAIQKGTVAYKARKWVTSEVLPAIRKQGRYECPAQAQLPPPSLSEQQAYAVMSEVAKRAKNCGAHYQTIYRALKARYQVTKYTHIPAASFDDAITFIRSMELRAPEVPQQEPRKGLWLSDHQAKRLATFLYELYDLFAPSFQAHYDLLVKVKSPDAPRFYESFHSFSAILLAKYLADNGYGKEATA